MSDEDEVDGRTLRIGSEPALAQARLPWKVVCLDGDDIGREFLIVDVAERVVGKSSRCDLQLLDATISRTHAALRVTPQGLLVRDLGSTNGSFLYGNQIIESVVSPGTLVRLGGVTLLVQLGQSTHRLGPGSLTHFGDLLGESAAMRAEFSLLERVAQEGVTVLIEGETGTGKELAARAIHDHSPRAQEPFIVFDCAGVSKNLCEGELFGHLRGAFTGALENRAGVFELGQGGTVFIDEIGELDLELQPKLLRALESRQVKRIGDSKYRDVDIRIVAATNRKLLREVKEGRFRQDLYHRLAVAKIHIPPLRARPEDIMPLVNHFLRTFCGDEAPPPLSAGTVDKLLKYPWPGNVRELRHVVERALLLSADDKIETWAIQMDDHSEDQASEPLATRSYAEARELMVDQFEQDYVADLLARFDGNVSKAAEFAGIDRRYIHKIKKKHGMA